MTAATPQSTVLIGKKSFGVFVNYIEADKYFAQEMQTYWRELRKEAKGGCCMPLA